MWRGSVLGALLMIAACGSKGPKQDSYPSMEEQPETTLPVPMGRSFPASGPLRGGAPKELIGVPVHVADSTLLLFADEQLEASQMIAKAVREAGVTVEDPKRTREIFDRAARGLHAMTGKPCGVGLDRTSAAKRWGAELGTKARVETAVYCESKCWIEVNIAEGIDPVLPPHPKRAAFYAAPYDVGQPWRSELPKRLGELTAFESLRDYGPAKLVPGAVPPAAMPDLAFADTNDRIDVPPTLAAATKQCLGTKGPAGLLVETDASDKVTRCEPYPRAFDGNRETSTCACNALLGKSLEGKGPRRVPIFTRDQEVVAKTTSGLELIVTAAWDQERDDDGLFRIKVSHPSIAGWDIPSWTVLEACFLSMSEGAIGVNVEVMFDAAGAATGVKLAPSTGTLTPAMEKCLRDAFMTSQASCPDVASSTGYASVSAGATRP